MELNKTYVISTSLYDKKKDLCTRQYYAVHKDTGYPYFTKNPAHKDVRTFKTYKDAIKFVEQEYDRTTNKFRNYYDYTIAGNIEIMSLTTTIECVYRIQRDRVFG